MRELDRKINEHFAGLVVRKDLVKTVKGNAIVPNFVLEYLLGQYCATSDEPSIQSGIESVKEILRKHYVHRNEAGLVKSIIREKGRHKVIDKIGVELNDKTDCYEASFSNLGISKVLVDSDTVRKNQKLLVGGVWCVVDLEYDHAEDAKQVPWVMNALKPIQVSQFDFDGFLEARKQFSLDEWIDLLVQSIGFNPEMFGRRSKLTQLVRLIPFCERNYNLIELGPKGTGKSHIYSDFSPHGILLSGGEVTVPKLFVNNTTGKIGLVGYWDTVAFDEFAGKNKRADRALVDILKNYLANKTFSRGIEPLGAEASMVFVGNTQHPLPYMLKHSDLFDELPQNYHDSAFIDRLHFYIPGWEVEILRGETFSDGYGFVVDYFAEILRQLRNYDYSHLYTQHFSLMSDISTRDREGINKTFSGLIKILFPDGEASKDEIEEILQFAIEGRKRIKDQLLRIDDTFTMVRFGYADGDGNIKDVVTLEEIEHPNYYNRSVGGDSVEVTAPDDAAESSGADVEEERKPPAPSEQHLTFVENQKGVSFDRLFSPYLQGATEIIVTDPYIRMFYQARNLMEFLETVAKSKADEDEVSVHLITTKDDYKGDSQIEYFERIQEACGAAGIKFDWRFENDGSLHARHIVLNNGWKVLLDRGLDIFQNFDMNDAFLLSNRLQQQRLCKAFEVTYIRTE